MSRRGHITDLTHIIDRTDLTCFKYRLAAAEDKVHGAFDQTACKVLTHPTAAPQLVRQKAPVTLDQICRQGTEKQRVLGGGQAAVFHGKVIAADAQRHLLSLFFRVEGIVDDGEIPNRDSVGAYRHGPGPECVVFAALLVELQRIVIIHDYGVFRPFSAERDSPRADDKLLTVLPRSQMNHGAFLRAINDRLQIICRCYKYFKHFAPR